MIDKWFPYIKDELVQGKGSRNQMIPDPFSLQCCHCQSRKKAHCEGGHQKEKAGKANGLISNACSFILHLEKKLPSPVSHPTPTQSVSFYKHLKIKPNEDRQVNFSTIFFSVAVIIRV